jgi:hypothetical protein
MCALVRRPVDNRSVHSGSGGIPNPLPSDRAVDRLPERWTWISLATAAEPAMPTGDAQAGRSEASAGNPVRLEEPSKNRGESKGRPGVDRSHGVQQDESAACRRLTQYEERIQGAREVECR